MRVAALCAGYGGLELGLTMAGIDHDLVWYAENDKHAAAVMAAHHQAPNLGDLTEIDNPPQVDVVTAGFPCQPVSTAGKRKGTEDARWLIRDVVRVARLAGAHTLLLENVPGLLTAQAGEAFGQVLAALAEGGFDVRWTHLRASDVGACHRRERWFAVAADADGEGPQGLRPQRELREGGVEGEVARRGGPAAFGPYAAAVRRWEHVVARRAPQPTDGERRLNPAFVEWMMGLPTGWVTDVVDKRTHALRILGNGVVPQQAAVAYAHLLTQGATRD